MAILWVIVYTPIFLYTWRSLDAAFFGLGASAVLEISLGGVCGKFNDCPGRGGANEASG